MTPFESRALMQRELDEQSDILGAAAGPCRKRRRKYARQRIGLYGSADAATAFLPHNP